MLSVKEISGVPFEYVSEVRRDPATKLFMVAQRSRPRTQNFLPPVQAALRQFVDNMNRFGMPLEAILTAGSTCCRCITGTNRLSNHSYGDAFDLVGVRWANSGGRETIMHNWDTSERESLRRINACLRLSFPTVYDYHRADHRDHFHCDMRRGGSRSPLSRDSLRFSQEALGLVLGRRIPSTGRLDAATARALEEALGVSRQTLKNIPRLNDSLDGLYVRIASGRDGATLQAPTRTSREVQTTRRFRPARPSAVEPAGTTQFERITLGGELGATPMTGIFVPTGYRPQAQVDMVIYFHGMKVPSGLSSSATISDIWRHRDFPLREQVNDSGKNVILVAPTLGPSSQPGKLTRPGGFDWYVDQVIGALAQRGPYRHSGGPPQVGNIVLAAHSAGGKVMRPVANRQHKYSSKIRECWGFDCLYSPCDEEVWRTWGIGHPHARLYIHYLSSTAQYSALLAGMAGDRVAPPSNVVVQKSSAAYHNVVPAAHLKDRIRGAPFQNR
ncbi:MAG: extensin family protein [Mycobacterium sp.]